MLMIGVFIWLCLIFMLSNVTQHHLWLKSHANHKWLELLWKQLVAQRRLFLLLLFSWNEGYLIFYSLVLLTVDTTYVCKEMAKVTIYHLVSLPGDHISHEAWWHIRILLPYVKQSTKFSWSISNMLSDFQRRACVPGIYLNCC